MADNVQRTNTYVIESLQVQTASDGDVNVIVEDRCATKYDSSKHEYSDDEIETPEEQPVDRGRSSLSTCSDIDVTSRRAVVVLSCEILSRSATVENLAMPAETSSSQEHAKDTDAGDGFQWTSARDRRPVSAGAAETRVDPSSIRIARPAGRFAVKTALFILFAALIGGYGWWDPGQSESHLAAPADYSRCSEYEGFSCENGGSLIDNGTSFMCECTSGYYGEHCAHETYSSMIYRFVDSCRFLYGNDHPQAPNVWWSFLPFTRKLKQKTIFTFYQERMKNALKKCNGGGGEALPSGADAMTYARILPANRRSSYCPAESHLPPLDSVYGQIFHQKHHRPVVSADTEKQNVLSHTFYQYFVLQFFGQDFNSTVTGSQLYGSDDWTRKDLRSWSNGKLRTEYFNGQHYPPRLSFVEKVGEILYSSHAKTRRHWFDIPAENLLSSLLETQKPRWALGHPFAGSSPLLFAMATLWVREHNRVCDELVAQWPEWTDERVYGTARRIVIGEMMGIMVDDVLNTGKPSPTKRDRRRRVEYVGSTTVVTPFELLLTTMLPIGLPQKPPGHANVSHSTDHGHVSGDTIDLMMNDVRDMLPTSSYNDDHSSVESVTKQLMRLSRENSVQGYNEYLRHLGLRPYLSFYELTRHQETADTLAGLYGHVDKVELLTGMLAERKCDDDDDDYAFPAFTGLGNIFVMNSILNNPLNSRTLWQSSTFGGDRGFEIVKSADMKSFIKNNLIDDDFVVDDY